MEWARRTGDPEAWRKWWQDPDARSYYFMGKDNIVFHSVIWPAICSATTARAPRREPGALGELGLPTEVVSSEFLTMEGRKFSSSRSVVIYVRDFLERYDADALRYFIAVAGPETQDTDFTWAEFVRRNNDELVAGWGNLVNRTVSMAAKNFGAIPAAGALTDGDRALLDAVAGGFAPVGGLIERHRQKAAHQRGDAGRRRGEQVPLRPGAVEAQARTRTGWRHVLHVALQAVDDCNTLLTPFLPHSAQTVHELLGGTGSGAACRGSTRSTTSTAAPATRSSPATTTPRRALGVTRRSRPARRCRPPTPVFTKLDPSVVEEELARLEARAEQRHDRADPRGPSGHRPRASRPPAPEPLRVPVADSHCHLDIVGAPTRPAAPRTRRRRRRRRDAHRPDRLRPAAARWAVDAAAGTTHIVAAVALHPNEAPRLAGAGELDEALAEIERLAPQPRVRAVGETGLDYFRTGPEGRAAQEASFRAHIAMAKRHDKTLVIHDRDAHDDVLRVLDEEGAPDRVVMHCFSGDVEFARACVDRGYFLCFAGTVTFKNAAACGTRARVTPLDRLLVETDAPYLTPSPYRGRPNAPYLIPLTVRGMAEVTGTDLRDLCHAINANTDRAFGGTW